MLNNSLPPFMDVNTARKLVKNINGKELLGKEEMNLSKTWVKVASYLAHGDFT